MAQKRELLPVTVYLPLEVIAFYEKKGAKNFDPVSATLRRIILADRERERRLGGKRDTTHS